MPFSPPRVLCDNLYVNYVNYKISFTDKVSMFFAENKN